MPLLDRTRPLPTTAPPPEPRPVPALWLALLATPLAASANSPVLILDDIADSFGVRTATATWLVTAFAWAVAVGTPLMAALLRRRGLRVVLRLSATLVLTGTAVVTAPWLPLAMTGRAVQALGGAGLVTAAMSLAGTVRRMGVITAGFGMFGAVGPLLGSLIADTTSWRLSLAVGAVALLALPAVTRRADPDAPRQTTPFDARGAALLVLLATSLVLVPRASLPATTAALTTVILLALHIRTRPAGFVPLSLLRTRTFLLSTLLACAFSTSYFTLLFTVPQLLHDRTDWSTSTIGVGQLGALLTGSALAMTLAVVANRLGHPRVLAILLTTGALAPLTALLTPWPSLLLPVATLAVLTTSAGQATLGVLAVRSAPPPQRPTAIGLFNLGYQLGGAFGPALAALAVLGPA
ncbi:MFS transporter [Streptomyces sp. R302]|uniref:MFS transporter n=1 Tax=unclassified Streptomyces TaxID=2593676 RepID=UPI00145CBDDD|nr:MULTISPECIES: MFS transporter [unclassified Streptomyces]NML51624.1 MFS transporter [Streptomyces sp. R301]NML81244.1 MFS transporter [Streptomyces sp. R302]